MKQIGEFIDDALQQEIAPIETGIKFLDDSIEGYYPGELTTILGEEECCKTAFVVHQVCHIAIEKKIPVLVLLNFLSVDTFIESMVAYYCGLEVNNVRDVFRLKKYRSRIVPFLKELKTSPLYITKEEKWGSNSAQEMLDPQIDNYGVRMVFVDELINGSDYNEKIGWLKKLAVRKHIAIVATCLTWNSREGMLVCPDLSDAAGTRSLFGHDVVLGFTNYEQHRIYQNENGMKLYDMIGIEVLKQRGRRTKKQFLISKDQLLFRNHDQR